MLRVHVVEMHPQKTKRPRHPELYDFITGKEGKGIAEKFGSQSFGYPIYAPGEPPPGKGASVPGRE